LALINLTEAQRLLGLSTRATLHRKVKSGELRSWPDSNGRPLVESEGLAETWRAIVAVRIRLPREPAKPKANPAQATEQQQPLPTPPAPITPPAEPPPPSAPAKRQQGAARPLADSTPPDLEYGVDDPPDITTERAWAEYEKRMHEREKRQLTTLTRMREEEKLVYKEDVEAAQSAINLQIMNRAEALPKQIKLDIPHLSLEEMAIIEKRVMEIFEAVAEHDFEELPE
jgi:hypothetical protein